MRFFVLFLLIIEVSANNVTYRLPTNVKPTLYSIRLHPNIDQGTFSGQVTIRIKVQLLTESITFHSSNLNITDVFLDQTRKLNVGLQEKYGLIEISLKNGQLISPGSHIIHINYSGKFGNHSGLFLAFDEDDNVLVVSDFQPGNARMAFPCFDEPAFKARFSVELVTPNISYVALSNMPQIDVYSTNKGIVYKFATSCVMSTYLVAFALTNYPYSELIFDYNSQKLPIRLFSPNASNDDEDNLKILNYIKETLIFYTNYTNVSYALPKLDFIEYDREKSIATENWGLVTVRRGTLSPSINVFKLSEIAQILTHEICHFWFGNLVTNEWWDDLWLQEGFAVYLSLKAEEYLLHNSATAHFSTGVLDNVFDLDQSTSSKPVVNFLETLNDIEQHFSEFSYAKGAAILLMIETVLGSEKFQEILQIYVNFFAYRTATTNDFITIVESIEPEIDMRSLIESFLYQNRFPLVYIKETNNSYILTQISSGYKKNDSLNTFGYKWTFPVIYKTDLKNQSDIFWFNKDLDKLIIPKNGEKWIILNYNGFSYYHTSYSKSLWNKIMENFEKIEKSVREHLLLEAVDLYSYDLIPCEIFIKLMEKSSQIKKGLDPKSLFIFSIHLFREMYRYDKKSVDIFQGYLKVISGHKFKPLTVSSLKYLGIEVNKTGDVPENVIACAKWIRIHLSKFV